MTPEEHYQNNERQIKECRHKSDELRDTIELLQKNWITKWIYRHEILRLQEKQMGLLSMALTYAGLR